MAIESYGSPVQQTSKRSRHIKEKCESSGRAIAGLQKELVNLTAYEKDIKHRMQDRMKFMSGKNARGNQAKLDTIEKQKAKINDVLSSLQNKVA